MWHFFSRDFQLFKFKPYSLIFKKKILSISDFFKHHPAVWPSSTLPYAICIKKICLTKFVFTTMLLKKWRSFSVLIQVAFELFKKDRTVGGGLQNIPPPSIVIGLRKTNLSGDIKFQFHVLLAVTVLLFVNNSGLKIWYLKIIFFSKFWIR